MSNNTITKNCPNPDCENCELYELETDGDLKRCPDCGTILETFSYVGDEELEDEEEDNDFEDDNDIDDITVD